MKTIKVPYPITREFIRAHPDWAFVYSSDYFGASKLGQAEQAANEPNTYPIPVRFRFCASNPDSYFYDHSMPVIKEKLDACFGSIPRDGRPIVIFPKIGMGKSDLYKRAPLVFDYIYAKLAELDSVDIEWDWYAST